MQPLEKTTALDPRLKSPQETRHRAHITRLQGSCGFQNIAGSRGNNHDFSDTTDAARTLAHGGQRGCRDRRNKPSEAGDRPAGEGSLHAFLAADRTVCVSLLRPSAWIFQTARYRTRYRPRLRLDGGDPGGVNRSIRDGWRADRRKPALDHEGPRSAASWHPGLRRDVGGPRA